MLTKQNNEIKTAVILIQVHFSFSIIVYVLKWNALPMIHYTGRKLSCLKSSNLMFKKKKYYHLILCIHY